MDMRDAWNEMDAHAYVNGIVLEMFSKKVSRARTSPQIAWYWRFHPVASPDAVLLELRIEEDCSFYDEDPFGNPIASPTRGPEPRMRLVRHHDAHVTTSYKGKTVSFAALKRFIAAHGPDSLRLKSEMEALLANLKLTIAARRVAESDANSRIVEQRACSCGGLNDNCFRCSGRGYFLVDRNGHVRG